MTPASAFSQMIYLFPFQFPAHIPTSEDLCDALNMLPAFFFNFQSEIITGSQEVGQKRNGQGGLYPLLRASPAAASWVTTVHYASRKVTPCAPQAYSSVTRMCVLVCGCSVLFLPVQSHVSSSSILNRSLTQVVHLPFVPNPRCASDPWQPLICSPSLQFVIRSVT